MGFQLSGIDLTDKVLNGTDLLSGSSALVFDFGQFLSTNSPVGFMISYKTTDGKQEQRDLLREFPSLRDRVVRMKARAEEFAKYSSQLGTMEYQLLESMNMVDTLRRGVDIANQSDAKVKPFTVVVDGEKITIGGNVLSALQQIRALLPKLKVRADQAERDRIVLNSTVDTLRDQLKRSGKPDSKNNFITQPVDIEFSTTALDLALKNRSISEGQYNQAVRGMQAAQESAGKLNSWCQ